MATTTDRVTGGAPPPSSVPAGLVRLLRPKQWIKNLLVFAGPGAAGVLQEADELVATVVALVSFCLAASGTYYLNDAADVEADRRHPTKRFRPVAAGVVPVPLARSLGIVLIALAVALGFTTGSWHLPAVIAGYVALTTSYTLWLKHVAVVDIAVVATGFFLRAIAGAAATNTDVSDWFLIVAFFASLFMVAGKRSAELGTGGHDAGQRAVLASYSVEYLLYVRAVASTVTVVAYVLWAFERAQIDQTSLPWYELSIVPFVLGILRYALRLHQGEGEAPEEVVLGDRTLEVLGLVWAVLFGLGVYSS